MLPTEVGNAAANGETDAVFAWLANHGGLINDRDELGWTLLSCAANGTIDTGELTEIHLSLCRDLIARGADVRVANDHEGNIPLHCACMPGGPLDGSITTHGYAGQLRRVLLDAGSDINARNKQSKTPLVRTIEYMSAISVNWNRNFVALVTDILRAGASLDIRVAPESMSPLVFNDRGDFESVEDLESGIDSQLGQELRDNESWLAMRSLLEGVRATGGTWASYAREPRRRVFSLRTLVARGRARPRRTRAADPIIEPVFRLPNELCWHVLQFWRATSNATGEVL